MEENYKYEEPQIRWNIKQSAKGRLYYEFTVRGNTIEEVKKLALQSKKELDTICGTDEEEDKAKFML